ncbi:MAG: phosphoribosyltransferase [Betaproteobacteria bacterium HGW-Betaproteobacteria-13]|nr:MAG: phosphoribosyltransferase [Betaproteobacteria bacterium HGW-Betaproteobacteria-21]PKO81230.1 MAG: phosphoribosyltransferase [Betaproteobacteria bacterium HGW-Betaproteobacteria-13]
MSLGPRCNPVTRHLRSRYENLSNTHRSLQQLLNHVLDVVMPQDCYLCGAASGGQPVCADCRAGLPFHRAASCPVCALPTTEGEVCGHCQRTPPAFDATRVAFDYVFPLDVLVQALKYRHKLALAGFFADALGVPQGFDLIVPMPLHPLRLSERGFNQAVEVARPLAAAAGLPLALAGLARLRNTPSQASLGRAERAANMRGAFKCTLRLDGMAVVVVDDVMTTGASLDEVARCLKACGAVRVENLVVARTPAPL